MIVVDASVLTNALTDDGPIGASARDALGADAHWAAPEHVVVEVFSAVRGRFLGGKISERRAQDALIALRAATVDLIAISPVLDRMWELRDNVSGYDAAYVAVAEALDCALVTSDARLGRVSELQCDVTVALPPVGPETS